MILNIKAPMTMPAKNANRQKNSERCAPINPLIMPLIPAIRPLNNNNNVDASPIKIPPENAGIGVKFSKVNSLFRRFWRCVQANHVVFGIGDERNKSVRMDRKFVSTDASAIFSRFLCFKRTIFAWKIHQCSAST